ncbi:MAG: hypothetical protein M3N98_06555 [Actinomycetota bacterium]|nr:hypothetical protein [Actinomycetota bacterium]
MLLETLLMVVATGVAVIVVSAVVIPRRRRAAWVPTWDNLGRLCPECEHELRCHDDRRKRRGCRADAGSGPCGCSATRQRAFKSSLTRYELQARRELNDL